MKPRVLDRAFTPEEEKKLLAAVSAYADVYARRDAAWMRFLRHTGMRIKAFSRLDVGDARDMLRTHHLHLEAVKRGRPGRIYIRRAARQALKTLLAIRVEMGHGDIADRPLVYSRKNDRMSVRAYQARMAHWCQVAGLEIQASPHWWRHTFAKRFIASSTAKDPRAILASQLNHSTTASTDQYLWPTRDEVEQAMEDSE